MLTFNIHMKSISKNVSRALFDYNKADFDSIRQELRTFYWNLKFQGSTLDSINSILMFFLLLDYWSTLKSVLLDLELAHISTR